MKHYFYFILAGKATFALTYKGVKYIYYVGTDPMNKSRWLVYYWYEVPEEKKWLNIGRIYLNNRKFYHSGPYEKTLKSMELFKWFWSRVLRDIKAPVVTVTHESKCGRCERKLTSKESIKNGLGATCLTKVKEVLDNG